MNAKNMRRFGRAMGAVALLSLLSGCVSASEPATDRVASIRGTNLCIINNSSTSMTSLWRGFPDERPLPPGATTCNSGREEVMSDVANELRYFPLVDGPRQSLFVKADNHWLNQPTALSIIQVGEDQYTGACGSFEINQVRTHETGQVHGDLKRIADSENNIEFVLTLTDSSAPVAGNSCTK